MHVNEVTQGVHLSIRRYTHILLYCTVNDVALWERYVADGIYLYISKNKSLRMHYFSFCMANRFHVQKQFSKPVNVVLLC